MNFLTKRINQLHQIISAWNSLDPKIKKDSINLVMPFIQSASLISVISLSENLADELEVFRKNYLELFQCDISKLGASDLSEESTLLLNEIAASADNEHQKKDFIDDSISGLRNRLIAELDHKYQNAHARISFNYGRFTLLIAENIKNNSDENIDLTTNLITNPLIADTLRSLEESKNDQDFFTVLVDFNNKISISENFSLLRETFNLDGLEEHTAINQASLYQANLDCAELINIIENNNPNQINEGLKFNSEDNLEKENNDQSDLNPKAANFFREKSQLKSIKVDISSIEQESAFKNQDNINIWQADYLANFGSKFNATIGFEMEFLILFSGGPQAEEKREKTDYEKLVKGLADLDARKKMRENYHFPHNHLASTPNILNLFSEEELDNLREVGSKSYSEKRSEIKSYLNKFKENPKFNSSEIDSAIANIDLLLVEELAFFDLFFLKQEQARKNKIVLDGVFDYQQNEEENITNILSDIANKGSFYKKTLDMIRAHEISFGPFNLEEAIEGKNNAISFVRNSLAEFQLRAKDRDVQINIGVADKSSSQSVINISENKQKNSAETAKVSLEINRITKDILQAIQSAVYDAISENPWIARKGQQNVDIAVDRKRGFSEEVKESKYYQSFEPNINHPLDSAFPIHRKNTGKASMLRFTRLNEDLAVIEFRLIGNNTHIPDHDEAVKYLFNGIEILPELFFPYLAKRFNKINDLEKKNDQLYHVEFNGSIAAIQPLKLEQNEELKKAEFSNKPATSIELTIKEKSYKKFDGEIAKSAEI
jgi:hypothetical protein